jgi:hypothetical protein
MKKSMYTQNKREAKKFKTADLKERWRQQGAREQLFCCRAKQSLNYV